TQPEYSSKLLHHKHSLFMKDVTDPEVRSKAKRIGVGWSEGMINSELLIRSKGYAHKNTLILNLNNL
ncbi:TPA: hypothetical protein ACF93Y_004738, partial [Klebsiella pneumoniae]